MIVFIYFHRIRCVHFQYFTAFCDCAFHFIRQCCHIFLSSAVCNVYFFRTQTNRGTCYVHSHIAATNNDYFFPFEIRRIVFTNTTQHFHSRHNAIGIFIFDAQFFIGMGTNRQIHCIILLTQFVHSNIGTYIHAVFHLYTSGQNMIQVIIQTFSWQAIAWNAVANHTAQLVQTFIYSHLMTHQLQIICSSHTTWTATDYGNLFPCGWCCLRSCFWLCMVNCIAFQRTNINGIIHHIAATVVFTWMFADKCTGCREWIIFANQLYSIGITAFCHQCHITWNIHFCRAERYTWNRTAHITQTASFFNVCDKIITEFFYTF